MINKLYRNYFPLFWQYKIDLIRGESQVFWPHFKDTQTLFIHIPKAAGTSVGREIYGRNVGHRKASFYHNVSKNEFNSLFSFSFTRNPWDRAVSAYHFAKQGGTDLVKPKNDDVFSSDYFRSFESFILEWLPQIDFKNEDIIFEPQYKYICDEYDNVLVNFVGKLENLSEDIKIIEDKLGRTLNIKHLNSSDKMKTYKDFYNEETKEVVAKIYEKDIRLFNYKFD
jgi:hypothetical protein